MNQVIRAVLNFLLFFLWKDFARTKDTKSAKGTKGTKRTKCTKSTKSTRKNQKHKKKKKCKNANKRTKIKNAIKKHLREKSHLFAYLRFCAGKEKKQKSLYNGNTGLTKLVKVLSALYEQKLFYQNRLKN